MKRFATWLVLLAGLWGCGPVREDEGLGAAGKCACGGAKCGCVKPLCGGTRACGCAGTKVDCQCAPKLCKSAGTYACCNGSHAQGGKQRCDSTCACATTKGACACSASCACAWKNR
ncbi:MAG TPA: hypothetical protein VF950_19660 [Planctomycetota bacterium]